MKENKEGHITWVVLCDKDKKSSENAMKEAVKNLGELQKTALVKIENQFKKSSAQARINMFAQLIEGLYNISNLPDYLKTGILFNSASIHNQLRPPIGQETTPPEKIASYIGILFGCMVTIPFLLKIIGI